MRFIIPLVLLLIAPALTATPRTILLVDDHDVLYHSGICRAIVPLKRHADNPLIAGGPSGQLAYCSNYRDPQTGRYFMWYQASGGGRGAAYAESDDGLNWTRPNLNLLPGFEKHNPSMVLTSDDHYGASVVVDPPGGDPARRYKMAYLSVPDVEGPVPPDGDKRGPKAGLYVAFSPDGIHWTKHPEMLLRASYGQRTDPPLAGDKSYRWGEPLSVGDVIDVTWDPIRKSYLIYAKSWIDAPNGKTYWKRCVVRTESKDFLNWSRPELVMAPDEFDGNTPAQFGGSRNGVQLHGAPVFVHEGVYFALLQPAFFDTNGHQPIELAISRDGIKWQRPWRNTFFLTTDGKDSFDSGRIWSSSTPIFLEDEVRFYYGAYQHPWNSPIKKPKTGIGLATAKRDRFVAVRPIVQVGQVTLKPMPLTSPDGITINADGSKGSVRVELLNEDGFGVPGFTKADAMPITTDALRHPVRWNPSANTKFEPGNYILRIHLDQAEVFAVTVP